MKIDSIKILKTYLRYTMNYPWSALSLLILAPLANISLRMLPPLVMASIITRLSNGDYIHGDLWGSFGKDIILFAGLIVLGGIILWRVVIYLIWVMETKISRDMNRDMLKKYLELDSNFHANNFGGSLVSRTNKLTGAYVRIQDTFLFQFYLMFIAYISITIIMFNKSLPFVIFMWVFTVFYVIISFFISKKVRVYATKEANLQNRVTAQLADAITNVHSIKSFASSKYENRRFAKTTEDSKNATMQVMWATIFRDIFSSSITSTVSVIALIISLFAVVNHNADLGIVLLIFTYTMDITERLWEFNSTALRNYNRAIGDSVEGIETLHTESKIQDIDKPILLGKERADIAFENVDFSHEGNSILFKNFNLTIKSGSKIGLVGHSGSGKTTLVRLLMRYIDIDGGQIKIGDKNIAKTTQDNLRENIAYVAQEPLLFHRSLGENISYGKLHATHKEVINAAKKAHADEFIKSLPKGYDTLVGERGVKLSGGQRQRVAIARAMIKEAKILVLDEATSALDSESEVLIQDALWKLMEGKTAIVIAHRLSTIQKMDRIIVMDDGKIVEDGSHKELLKKGGTYARLWAHQSGGFLEE